MNKNLLGILVFILTSNLMFAGCKSDDDVVKSGYDGKDLKILQEWQAGKTVSSAAVEAFGGVDKCFAAEPIPDNVWERMQDKTYKENPTSVVTTYATSGLCIGTTTSRYTWAK